MKVLPRCRFGDAKCYFKVEICTPTLPSGQKCEPEMKKRSIEGSENSDEDGGVGEPFSGAEALAIPALAVAMTALPALTTSVGLLFKKMTTDILSISKVLVGVSLSMLFIGVRTIQDLTFDCRWWNDNLHGHGEKCHHGLNLYIAAVCLFVIAQITPLVVATHALEDTYYDYYSSTSGTV